MSSQEKEENKIGNKKEEVIDLREVFRKIKSRKRLFIKVLIITFILSCAWILPKPRTYTSTVTLAPEMTDGASGGSLGSIAASFGFSMNDMQTTDAIYPNIYPELISSTGFVTGLFDVKVQTEDGSVNTDYYTYLTKHQKSSFWSWPVHQLKKWIKSWSSDSNSKPATDGKVDPARLTEEQEKVVEAITAMITCDIDKKNNIISITVIDQDRIICATMADSVCARLQDYIIDYRTKKARVDVAYYEDLLEKAKVEYDEAVKTYNEFNDARYGMYLESDLSNKRVLQNEVQAKLEMYNSLNVQLQTAKAKLQERTPSFTVIQCASAPNKPSGPKRMIFVFAMMVLATLCTVVYVFKKDVMSQLTHMK